jgi:succinate dehydrogenase hydrophobic anchor subunit
MSQCGAALFRQRQQEHQKTNTMKPSEIFKLAIRILGLVFLYHGLMGLPTIFTFFISMSPVGILLNIVMVVWPLVVAWWLIGGAPLLLHRAYPDNTP